MAYLAGLILLIQEVFFFDWNTNFQPDDFAFFVSLAPLVSNPPLNPKNINPPEPIQYVHFYHTDIVQADVKSLAQCSNTAATDILAPHPLCQSTAITGSINIDKKTLFTTDLPTLSSTKHNDIHDWYIKLCHQTTSTQIDLCPLKYFKKGHALWPQNLPAPIVLEMGNQLLYFFCNSNFESTDDSLILFYICTGSTGAPVESQRHLWLTIANNPLSVALLPSPPTAAGFTNTGIKDVSINEKNTEIGHELTEFMSSIDSFDQDRFTPCFDFNPSPTLPFEAGLHDTGIKDASSPKTTTKNGLKSTAFLREDYPTSQDDTTLLSDAHFDKGRSPIPLIAACPKNIGIGDVPIMEKNDQKGTDIDQFLAR